MSAAGDLSIGRREAIRRLALLMGGAMAGSAAILRGEPVAGKEISEAFSSGDCALLDEIGETIIPQTDTPGAKALGIGAFMAMMVTDCYSEADHRVFKAGLFAIDGECRRRFGAGFVEASPAQRAAVARELDERQAAHARNKAEGEPEHYFRMMKDLTILGVFSSEAGSKHLVRYVEVPGAFKADIPYHRGDPTWY